MPDSLRKRWIDQSQFEGGNVDVLATTALSFLAQRQEAEKKFFPQIMFSKRVQSLIMAASHKPTAEILDEIYQWDISPEMLIDYYIPEAARFFGEQWCNDKMSFADVTINVARLQNIVRDITANQDTRVDFSKRRCSLLMIVPKDEDHTLGAMVATTQLRRIGCSVRLALGQENSQMMETVANEHFDGILISTSRKESLELIREFSDLCKSISTCLPVILGGYLVDTEHNLKSLTGVDYVTNDPHEAIRLCGLKTHHRSGASQEIWR
ncbi:cobalamin B12-binding domain-containing protein [Pseudaestuariivita rosea]|uniref:cobalamin B12-binding domain-containing protein n=1 Tax=Pseudaestuariivita rosea TaxID=2763263 RepID=UPI001ABA7E0C|nr:cobalamin B12-binding domain-containing protein [Pseudaestuariivita rosea]